MRRSTSVLSAFSGLMISRIFSDSALTVAIRGANFEARLCGLMSV